MHDNRTYLKQRCFPDSGDPNDRLIAKLHAGLGPRQLREVLLGAYDDDEWWQSFCVALLEEHRAALRDSLLAIVVREMRRLEAVPLLDCVVADVLYESLYGDGQLRTEADGRLRARACSPAPPTADLTMQLLQSLLLLNVAAACLAHFDDEAVDTQLVDLLSRAPVCTSRLVTRALFERGGVERLCALAKRLPIENLAATVDASPAEARGSLERLAFEQVEGALREGHRLPVLEAALHFLPTARVLSVCYECLGDWGEKQGPRQRALEVLLTHAQEAAATGTQYLAATLVLERHLPDLVATPDGAADSAAELADEDAHTWCWTWIKSVVQVSTDPASDLDEAALLIAATTTCPRLEGRHLLRCRIALGWIAADLLDLVTQWGQAGSGRWFVYALRGQTALYGAAFNGLLALGDSVWPFIVDGLERYPELIGSLARLTERIGGDDPPTDVVEAIARASATVEDDELANVAILLARAQHPAAKPLLTRLLRHADPYLQAAGLHAASLAGVSTTLPSVLVALLHPVQHVRAEARYALLRWRSRAEALIALRRAAHSRSTVLQLKALDLLHALGDETLGALLEDLGRDGRLPAGLPEGVFQPVAAPLHDAVLAPRGLTPPGYEGPLLAHWRRYRLRLSRHPKLFRLFTDFADLRMLDDEQYLAARDAMSPAGGCLQWFLYDLVEDYTAQLREVFQRFFGLGIPDQTWQEAVFSACRMLDRDYLAHEWQRGRPDLAMGEAEGMHWQLAIRWLIEDQLHQRLHKEIDNGLLYQTLPNPQRQRVICEWLWLNCFPNWYWTYDLRPRLSLEELAQYVASSGWERFRPDGPLDARIAHQIIDYLAFYTTTLPCPVTFKQECRKALQECFRPLMQRHRRRWLRRAGAAAAKTRLSSFDRSLRDCVAKALDEYDPFWGGPPEPMLPLGMPLMRLQKLPKNVYGRGIPFAHFLERRLARLFSEPVPGPGELPYHDDGASPDDREHKGKPKQRISSPGKHIAGQLLLPGEFITDDQDRDWVTVRGLEALAHVPESTLRAYDDDDGVIGFRRIRGMRVVPADAGLPELIEDILAHRVLKHPNGLKEIYGVSPRTLYRWIQALPKDLGPATKLRQLAKNHPPPQEDPLL